MKKILSLFLAVFMLFGSFQIISFAEPPGRYANPQSGDSDFEGIDGTYEFENAFNDNTYRDVYISHPTFIKTLKNNAAARSWASVVGTACGKVPGLGWWVSLGVSAAMAFLATCDAKIEDIDGGYGIIVPFVYIDDESGWGPCGEIRPQDEWGYELATDWEGSEYWAYQMYKAGIPLTDIFKVVK